jgi:hypothetical protein
MAGRIAYYGGIVKDGLVLNLDAAKTDSYPKIGTAWNDISGNRNNSTLTNGPTFDSKNGGSIVLDGVNDYGILNSTLDIGIVGSWSIWLNATTFGGVIIGSNIPNYYMLYYDSSIFYINYGGALGSRSSSPLSVGIWYNIAVTRNGNTHQIFLNGSPVGGTLSITTANTSKFSIIGDERIPSVYPFRGKIASLSVYNRVLTTTEITQNYNALKGRFGL